MKIGIIGTGNMGRALGRRWARAGNRVLFGSRDPEKAGAVAAGCAAEASVRRLAEDLGFVGVDMEEEARP